MASMTRDEHRQRVVAQKQKRLPSWAFFILASPGILVVFLGDILSAPFVARRHQSTDHWLLYMFARFAGPGLLVGLCLGYLIRRWS